MRRIVFFVVSLLMLIFSSCQLSHNSVSILYDSIDGLEYTVDQLTTQLEKAGFKVFTNKANGKYKIHLSADSDNLNAEAYEIKKEENDIYIKGGDHTGIMYGAFDVIENVEVYGTPDSLVNTKQSPRMAFRSIKHNLPWDSYRTSEALQLHMETCQDLAYWERFLDMMARNRFNTLTLWNLHPFDRMIRSEKYPEACALTDDELAEWQEFWHTLFKMAKDRGIETYIVFWNIFVSDAFAEKHNVAKYSIDNTYFGVSDRSELVKDYNRESISQMIDEYPNLTGIGFGLGEAMEGMTPKEREEWAFDVIVKGMQQAKRKAKLIHRLPFSADKESGGSTSIAVEKMTRKAIESIDLPDPIWVEVKYNWSHGHSLSKLVKTHGGKISNTYWNPEPKNYKITWMVQNEDFFCLRWCHTPFIRYHINQNMHSYVGGYSIGSECYIPAVDYFTKLDGVSWDYAFERQWLYYKAWGRLMYNPQTSDSIFVAKLQERYQHGEELFNAYTAAGRTPLIIASLWDCTDDFTLYSEGLLSYDPKYKDQMFMSVKRLIEHEPLDPDLVSLQLFIDIWLRKVKRTEMKKVPMNVALELNNNGKKILKILDNIEIPKNDKDLLYEVTDLKVWAYLALYLSEKIRGSAALDSYIRYEDKQMHRMAIGTLTQALTYYKELVSLTEPLYNEMPLVHLNNCEDKYFHWSKYLDEVEADLEYAKTVQYRKK